MIIINEAHRILRDQVPVAWVPAKNHGEAITATAIVCHDTASGLKPDGDIDWLARTSPNASAHVVIARDGAITQLVGMNQKAWHAGQSKWGGRNLCNGFTLGLEIDNPGRLTRIADGIYKGVATLDCNRDKSLLVAYAKTPQHGEGHWLAYTDAQIESVTGLCRALIAKYPTIREILTHWLISPGRKIDTNPLFPLEQLRDRVLGGADPIAAAAPASSVASIADATVTVNDLNLRALPNGAVTAVLDHGQRVDVQEAHEAWLRVVVVGGLLTGKSGYVYSKFLKLD